MTRSIIVKTFLAEDGKATLLDKLQYDIDQPVPAPEPEPEPEPTPVKYEVVVFGLRVRSAPDVDAPKIGELPFGAVVDTTEHTEADGFVWRKHSTGWSAERALSGGSPFMVLYDPKAPSPQPGGKAPVFGPFKVVKYNGAWHVPNASDFGANVRELMYFGTSVMPNTTEADIHGVLDSLKREGCTTVRFYVSHHKFNDVNWQAARLAWLLEIFRAKGMKAVPVFMDSLALSGFYIQENQPYHTASNLGHLNINYYLDGAYRTNTASRLRVISRVIGNYADVVSVFDLCNEPAIVLAGFDDRNANAFKQCWVELSQIAYAESGKKVLLTLGIIDSLGTRPGHLNWLEGALWFWDIDTLHVMSVHMYYDNFSQDRKMYNTDLVASDADAAFLMAMPIFIGECGFSIHLGDNRSNFMRIFLDRDVIGNGAGVCLNWGADFRWGSSDKGFTDEFAIADFYPDFFDLLMLIGEYNSLYFHKLQRI